MKTPLTLPSIMLTLASLTASAQNTPPISVAPASPPPSGRVFTYDQQAISSRPTLVTPEQARTIINRFRAAYPNLDSPRMLIYVNRALVDEQAGLKLTARTEK